MLNHPTVERLRDLGLVGMIHAFEEQRRQPDSAQLSFEDRLAMLVDREVLRANPRSAREGPGETPGAVAQAGQICSGTTNGPRPRVGTRCMKNFSAPRPPA